MKTVTDLILMRHICWKSRLVLLLLAAGLALEIVKGNWY